MLCLSENFYYPPLVAIRALMRAGIETLRFADQNSENYRNFDYNSIFHLNTHSRDCTDYTLPAALMLAYLINSNFVSNNPDQPKNKNQPIGPEEAALFKSDCILLGGLILKHIQQCQVNAVRICETIRGSNLRDIGCGLYSTFSLANHSCRPNLRTEFDGTIMKLIATEEINEGDELFISYGVSEQSHSVQDRKKYLKENYFFECQCDSCRKLL